MNCPSGSFKSKYYADSSYYVINYLYNGGVGNWYANIPAGTGLAYHSTRKKTTAEPGSSSSFGFSLDESDVGSEQVA